MDQDDIVGILRIYIYCVMVRGTAVITARKIVSTCHQVTRMEARLMVNEHAKQAGQLTSKVRASDDYTYEWQPHSECLQPSS